MNIFELRFLRGVLRLVVAVSRSKPRFPPRMLPGSFQRYRAGRRDQKKMGARQEKSHTYLQFDFALPPCDLFFAFLLSCILTTCALLAGSHAHRPSFGLTHTLPSPSRGGDLSCGPRRVDFRAVRRKGRERERGERTRCLAARGRAIFWSFCSSPMVRVCGGDVCGGERERERAKFSPGSECNQ